MNLFLWIGAGVAVSTFAWLAYRFCGRTTETHSFRSARALRESDHKYRTVLAAANDAVMLADVESGRIIDSNRRAEELVGLARPQLVGTHIFELCPGDEFDRYQRTLARAKQTGSGSARSLQVAHQNGYLVSVDVTIRIISLENRLVSVNVFRTTSGPNDPEEVLRQERSFTHSVLETVQALIVVLDAQGRIVRFNRMCEALTGYSVDQVRGRFLWETLIPDRESARVKQVFVSLLAGDIPSSHETAWLTKHGTERLLAWSYGIIRDSKERVQHVIATGIDMTARRSAEEGLRRAHDEMEKRVVLRTAALRAANDALVQSEARLAEAQQIAHVGSWEWNLISGQLFWSDEVFRIFGMTPGQIFPTFEILLSMVHPDDRAAVSNAADEAVRKRTPLSLDYRLLQPNGAQRVVHAEGVVNFDSSGRAQRMTGTVQDITERKAAEEALRRAHDDLEERVERRTAELRLANQALSFTQFAMDHAADAVFWMNDEFQFIYVNDTACRFLGYERSELLALGIAGISPASNSEECRSRFEKARQSGGLTFVWLFRRADGSELPVEITANRLRFEDNENVCLFARDISERRRAEESRQAQLQAARTLSAISLRFVAFDDIDFAVKEAVTDLVALLEARCAWLLRVDKELIALEWHCMCGEEDDCCNKPPEERFLPLVSPLREGEVQVLANGSVEERGDTLVVPLFAEKVLVGAIAFDGVRQTERWREGDFPLLRVAARVITGAIQRHRAELQTMTLLEENRRLARQSLEIQESERAHLARELHDELGQCLTAILADAQTVCRLSKGREPRIYDSGKAIAEVASRVYEVVRNMMRRLRPEMLDELGLGQALHDVVNQWRTRHPETEWVLSVSEPLGFLPEAVEITAFRVVQECITNVVKHAKASRVQVQVTRGKEGLEVLVCDNGLGQAPTGQRGFGLLGMRERVLAVGGRFEVSNQPGEGYRIHAVFPVMEIEEQEHGV